MIRIFINVVWANPSAPVLVKTKGANVIVIRDARASAPIIISAKAGYSLLENAIYSKIGIKTDNKRISNIKMMRYWGEFFLN